MTALDQLHTYSILAGLDGLGYAEVFRRVDVQTIQRVALVQIQDKAVDVNALAAAVCCELDRQIGLNQKDLAEQFSTWRKP